MIEKYLSGGMCGYDREGSPIWYDVIGPVDPKGLFLSASKQDFIKSKIRDCEMLQKECNLQSQRVRAQRTQIILVLLTCRNIILPKLCLYCLSRETVYLKALRFVAAYTGVLC